ncbi:MAG: TonB family protein [Rhodocyclaceae bacterium]|nr:TonB family protein [Rhodocyclaceae bacterium]
MHAIRSRFAVALLCSLLLHALVLAPAGWWSRAQRADAARPPPLVAKLVNAKIDQPELHLPPQPPKATASVPPAPKAPTPQPKPALARKSAAAPAPQSALERELGRHLHYPLEAVERGLEGDVLVRIFFDDAGAVIAARVEKSSGHALLDEAAVTAARAVRTTPAAGTTEAQLPVRFRLQ